jgi:choline dehydrogenase
VERLLIEERRARGVVFRSGDAAVTATAREVIVCGGSINSPQILMLSGIGNADDLKRFGLPVVHHLPGVGRNLQDHIYAHYLSRVTPDFSINDLIIKSDRWATSWQLLPHVLQYIVRRRGLLSSAAAQAGAFIRSGPHVNSPDLQVQFRPFSMIITKDGASPPSPIRPRPRPARRCGRCRAARSP